jgi:outer membrane lipoprotein-sorting protein
MARLKYCILLLAIVLLSATAMGQDNELRWSIDSAVKQLDRQGSDFDSVLAELTARWSDSAADSDRISSGRLFMDGRGNFRIDTGSGQQILRRDSTVQFYKPELSRVDEYRLSRHPERLEPFIPLGFSVTGKDLDDDFLVSYIGEEQSGERRLLGLELTPKRDKTRAIVSKIELWVDQASWLPARQVIVQASGGATLTLEYAGMARNLSLNPDLFRENWPRGTKTERM